MNSKPGCVSPRRAVVLLSTLASALMYAVRYSMSISIIAMTKLDEDTLQLESNLSTASLYSNDSRCPLTSNEGEPINVQTNPKNGEFDWSASVQSTILSAYFVGHVLTQVSGGRMAEAWSAKWTVAVGVIGSSVASCLTPISARTAVELLMAMRLAIGAFHGLIYSGIYTLFSAWIPKEERASALSFAMCGANLGAMLGMSIASSLSEAINWAASFYVFGALGFVWLIVWSIKVTDSPVNRRTTSDPDKVLNCSVDRHRVAVPWKAVFTSKRVYATLIAKTSSSFGYYFIRTELPSYLAYVLHISIGLNGILNSISFVILALSLLASGHASDWMLRRKIASATTIRKLFEAVSQIGPSICIIGVTLSGCDQTTIVTLFLVGIFLHGALCGGDIPIVPDFAPDISGSIFGFTNTFGVAMGIVSPIICGYAVDNDIHSRENWSFIFYLSSALFAVGGLLFCVLADATPDPRLRVDAQNIN